MALNDYVIVPKDGIFTIEDATGGTPISMTLQYTNADLQLPEMEAGFQATEIFRSRGTDFCIAEVGELEGMEVTLTAYATDFGDAIEKTIPDMCMKTGAWAAGVSVFGANRPWGVKFTFTAEQTNYGAGADSSMVYAKVRPVFGFQESGSAGTFQLRFKIFNPSATITRS